MWKLLATGSLLETEIVHDDVIKWKHFPRHWPFVRGIHRSTVSSPYKGKWRGALMFPLIYAWINAWVNNRKAGDSRRHRAHYDVIVINAKTFRGHDVTILFREATTCVTPRFIKTHLALNKMAAILQSTFSNTFFWMKRFCILTNISLTFIPKGQVSSIPTLVQKMTWRRKGDKPLS